ncbi:MAG: hypothetical protein IT578_05290 [Verrucomicrobiae bacterium]|nr:hypothetical protein [Verrucomicrobiae bacterium]
MRRQPAKREGRRKVVATLGFGILTVCSLQAAAPQGATEAQELRVAIEALRRENAELRRAETVRTRETATASNHLARLETALRDGLSGLAADDAEARSSADWRALLLQALHQLRDAEAEITRIEDRLRRLTLDSEKALKTAQKVDPARRAALEGQLRAARQWSEGRERNRAAWLDDGSRATHSAKVTAVRADLGVAALGAGRAEGVRVGMLWEVNRGKEVTARLVVAETREHASLALIERMDADRPIRAGETAVLSRF